MCYTKDSYKLLIEKASVDFDITFFYVHDKEAYK